MDNLHNLSYQFKICVTLEENTQSLSYLEKLMNFVEEYSREEIEIINRLVKNMIHYGEEVLLKIIEINQKNKKQHKSILINSNNGNDISLINDKVIQLYTLHSYNDIISSIERLLSCVLIVFKKTKAQDSIVLLYKCIGKLNAFLSLYEDTDKSQHLELALKNYQQAITLLIANFEKTDLLRLRVFLSYCKFTAKYLLDYYRSVLFCINVMEDLKEEQLDPDTDKIIIKISTKYKQFYKDNIENYNKVISKYYH